MQLLNINLLVGRLLPELYHLLLETVNLLCLAGQLCTCIRCTWLLFLTGISGFMQRTLSLL